MYVSCITCVFVSNTLIFWPIDAVRVLLLDESQSQKYSQLMANLVKDIGRAQAEAKYKVNG